MSNIKITPFQLNIKNILMVLITSLFIVELYLIFMNFREGQLTLFLGHLEVKGCAHAQNKSFSICII